MTSRPRRRGKVDNPDPEQVLRRANARTQEALESVAAQEAAIQTMGMRLSVRITVDNRTGKQVGAEIDLPTIDMERWGFLAVKLRPFQLCKEAIHHEKVVDALRVFADTEPQKVMVEQLPSLWEGCRRDRMHAHVSDSAGTALTPGWVGDSL